MATMQTPKGDEAREAIDSLRGYVYQMYQSAIAWIELETEEFLFLEVAEDYAVVANNALNAVQVKETGHRVTINSEDIVASIDSFVDLRKSNPQLQVRLRHLTTSRIGKERSTKHRIGDTPTLDIWRKYAKTGELVSFRKILEASKLSGKTKNYIRELDDSELRENFLKRIHFDCGALESKFLVRQLRSKLLNLLLDRGGVPSQVDGCLSSILMTLLQKATQRTDRFVDRNTLEELLERTTQIPINRAQFEAQYKLFNKALAASLQPGTNLVTTRLGQPRPIDEVPLPAAIASRTTKIDNILSSLFQYGVSWVFGAAGVGKTIGAKMVAKRLGGNWASINLRNLNAEQVDAVLSDTIKTLTEQRLDGLIVDDFECPFEPYIVESLLDLKALCDRADILLLPISSRLPSSDFMFSANLPMSIAQKFEEFSELDIREILAGLGVQNTNWAKYIYFVSGGGHPQLAIAAIQSMQNNGWNTSEFRTRSSLFNGNTAVEQVRARTRERLLNELPEAARRLLERLSLKFGSFQRAFVLNMAQVPPLIPDGGIVFDQLIGSWVDQQERDRFALSPLLSNFAVNTLADEQKREIYFEIADYLVKLRSLDPIEANSAVLAAWSGKNTQAIRYLCMAVLRADQNDLEMIAPHMLAFTLMRTDTFAYENDPEISQMFRGAQLLLMCYDDGKRGKIKKILDLFEIESDRVDHEVMRTSMTFLLYVKLLLSTSKFGALPNYCDIIQKLDVLLENQGKHLPSDLLGEVNAREIKGVPVVGFMFLNQTRQIKLINELIPTFEFLNSCGRELRQKLLKPYSNPDFDVDMLVSGAWLNEHEGNTIDPPSHSDVFSILENFAQSWDYTNLSVCCRKYRAIIIDEYGNDRESALAVLDEGLKLYGKTNSELERAKARVLYRAGDHKSSLYLSKALIDGEASLNETEKAFLGRDAAISAEKQGDYETARRYYLYGSNAAGNCGNAQMIPMGVGLMADAALASWHAEDRETCLRDFLAVLQELNGIDFNSSLRAAHCHAGCRHILVWLNQEATGKKWLTEDGEETKIYPGIVSNPEPHPEIGKRYIAPIEMAWYLLAALENHCCLEIGITNSLENYLPKGPIVEGQFWLTSSKMSKAFKLLDTALFVAALRETVAQVAYFTEQGDKKKSFDMENVTCGSPPVPTLEQQTVLFDLTEQLVLCFVLNCIFTERIYEMDRLTGDLMGSHGFKFRKEFVNCLQGEDSAIDYNTTMAALLEIHRCAITENRTLSPREVFELAFKALQLGTQTKKNRLLAKPAFHWLNEKWAFILEHQSFLLKCPVFYKKSIDQVHIAEDDLWIHKIIALLQAILPTLGFQNENQVSGILNDMRKEKR